MFIRIGDTSFPFCQPWEENEEKVAELLERIHNRTENRTYNSEAALSYSIQMGYLAAEKYYTTMLELDSGKGYVDIAYIPAPKYSHLKALLIELKYDQNASSAICQIKQNEYPERLAHYKGNMLLVGIDYDKDVSNKGPEFKHHSCVIERG